MHRSLKRTLRGVAVTAVVAVAVPTAGAAQEVVDLGGTSDPTLVRLIEEALGANPSLEAAEARIRVSRAARTSSLLDLAPTVTAVGGYTRQRMSGAVFPGLVGRLPDQDVWEAGVPMSWDVDLFGERRRTLAARSGLVEAAGYDVRDARVLLAAEVAGGYVRLLGAQDRLAVSRSNAENQRRTLEITEERLAAGRGTALDRELASAQLSSTLAAIPALEAAVTAEQHRLSTLLGREPGTVVERRADERIVWPLPPSPPSGEREALLGARPDVVAAERRLEAAGDLVGAARAAYLPRVSLRGAAGYTASAFHGIGDTGTPRYAVGPVLSWPLLDIGRVRAEVDRARAERSEAEARHEYVVLQARSELATAEAAYERARERLTHLEAAAEASGRATELARLRFAEGAGDFLEVLDAERRLLEAEDRLADGRTAAADALVSVYRALGVEWWSRGSGL